ncbi:MAG: ABC-2 family transporter protein [Clostridia bacterium]|nr:ABC-2 family transporter protein [Clostridia bacterium]
MRYVINAMRMNLRRAAQYRASFWMQTLAQLVMTFGDLWAMLLLAERFGGMAHWSLHEVMFFFGPMQIAFAITEMINRGFGHITTLIRMGSLDTMLTRPRGIAAQVILSELDPRRIGSVAVGLTALIVATRELGVCWTLPNILLILWGMAGAIALMMGLFMLEAVVCLFSVQSVEIVNVFTYGGRQTCQYPLDLYPQWLRITFTFVIPVGLCLQYPICHILGKSLGGVEARAWVWLSPLAGPFFLGLMWLLWRWGLRHYRSTGS